ncbi:MAG: hypothetical protein HY975_00990 [Candidatus Kerfeldbacteria bacterium]|nr:hypothetical protein [Candidatus Kerfeldbacteria bacterium]
MPKQRLETSRVDVEFRKGAARLTARRYQLRDEHSGSFTLTGRPSADVRLEMSDSMVTAVLMLADDTVRHRWHGPLPKEVGGRRQLALIDGTDGGGWTCTITRHD